MNACRPLAVIATLFYLAGQQCPQPGFDELDGESTVAPMAHQLKQLLATEVGSHRWQSSGSMLYVDGFRDPPARAIATDD